MDYKKALHLEPWFLQLPPSSFPGSEDYVAFYKTLKEKLRPIHKQVTAGADYTDGTSLTWHDDSHIEKVIQKASELLTYKNASVSPFEAFILLVSIQLHDIMNSDGRTDHENRAIEIFSILEINGLVDNFVKDPIKKIISCHSGSFKNGDLKEKDKIGFF